MAIDLFIPSSNFHLNLSFSNFVQTEGEMNKNIAIYKYSKLGGGVESPLQISHAIM